MSSVGTRRLVGRRELFRYVQISAVVRLPFQSKADLSRWLCHLLMAGCFLQGGVGFTEHQEVSAA